MDALERLKLTINEFEPESRVVETANGIIIQTPNGIGTMTSPDKSDENIEWMIREVKSTWSLKQEAEQ